MESWQNLHQTSATSRNLGTISNKLKTPMWSLTGKEYFDKIEIEIEVKI